jgi:hypothetical protein
MSKETLFKGESRDNYKEKIEQIKTPCYLKLKHKLTLLFFDFEEISYKEFWKMIDNPNIQIPEKRYVITDNFDDRLPLYTINYDPFTPELNKIIEEKYHLIEKYVKTQKDIKNDILKYVVTKTPKIVILYLVDGLSYWDFINSDIKREIKERSFPIFVNGKTSTENGFKNIIYGRDNFPITKEMYKLGYDCYGLTYWKRNNKITNILFKFINEENIFHYEGELLKKIENNPQKKKYIQVYRMGLDELAHGSRIVDEEMINKVIIKIFNEIFKLEERLKEINGSYVIFVTSDHGIKWDFKKQYRKGSHGGISFEECFVPLIIIEG